MQRGPLARALAVTAALCSSGCSVDNIGTVAGQVVATDTATIVTLYALGGQVRTMSDDRGLSLAYARRVYVYPAESARGLEPGWHYGLVPLPDRAPVLVHGRTLGGEVDLTYGLSLTLGLRDVLYGVTSATRDDSYVEIDYRLGDVARTQVTSCTPREGDGC